MFKKIFKRMPFPFYPYKKVHFKHKALFVHIPKNAGSSVMKVMGDSGGRLHLPWHIYRDANEYAYRSMHKFAIVRHPVDRLHSVYQYLLKGGNQKTQDIKLSTNITKQVDNFDEFVNDFIQPYMLHQIDLLKPQFTFICDKDLTIQVNTVLRYEQLSQDWLNFSSNFKLLDSTLPLVNQSTTTKPQISINTQQAIYKLYQTDFSVFNYSLYGTGI